MTELSSARFRDLLPMVNASEADLVFGRSVLLGFQSGRVFVDGTGQPEAALVRHSCGVALLCGTLPSPDILAFTADLLLGKTRLDEKRFRLHCGNRDWERALETMIGPELPKYEDLESTVGPSAARDKLTAVSPARAVAWTRVRFGFDPDAFRTAAANMPRVPEGFTLRKLDAELYGRIVGSIVPSTFWDSSERFLASGIGFCLVAADGSPASTAFSAYIDDRAIDIGIETAPPYRGLGLARIVCGRMTEYCLENGYEPVWGTRADNDGSRALAKKLGFVESGRHAAYYAAG